MLPKRLKRTTIYESEYVNVYVDKVEMPSGKIIEKYHQLDYPREAVIVLVTNARNEICFTRNLRYTTQRVEWELPSGGIEKGEDILTAAQREVLEETGFTTDDLKLVCSYNPSNGISNQVIHVVFAGIESDIATDFDTDEVAEVHWLSHDETKELIRKKKIADGSSLLPLLLYFSGLTS